MNILKAMCNLKLLGCIVNTQDPCCVFYNSHETEKLFCFQKRGGGGYSYINVSYSCLDHLISFFSFYE